LALQARVKKTCNRKNETAMEGGEEMEGWEELTLRKQEEKAKQLDKESGRGQNRYPQFKAKQ
jgi:hypothetical protein